MTSHRDSHTTTDVKPEIIPGILTGNGIPNDKYDVCDIAIRAQTENTTFSWKDDCTLMKHTLCWTYSTLQYFFNLYWVILGDALTSATVQPFFLKNCLQALLTCLQLFFFFKMVGIASKLPSILSFPRPRPKNNHPNQFLVKFWPIFCQALFSSSKIYGVRGFQRKSRAFFHKTHQKEIAKIT